MLLEALAVHPPANKLDAFQDPNFVDGGKVEMRFGCNSVQCGAVRYIYTGSCTRVTVITESVKHVTESVMKSVDT